MVNKKNKNIVTIILAIIIIILLFLLLKGCNKLPGSNGGGSPGGGNVDCDSCCPGYPPPNNTNYTYDDRPPCSSIINPRSPADCNNGRCDRGDCVFIPATITMVNRCECQWCDDTDGGQNIRVKGTCTDYTGASLTDICPIAYAVSESFCVNNRCSGASMTCPSNTSCYYTDGYCR